MQWRDHMTPRIRWGSFARRKVFQELGRGSRIHVSDVERVVFSEVAVLEGTVSNERNQEYLSYQPCMQIVRLATL